MFRTLVVIAVSSFSSMAFAQSSLGITGAQVSLGQIQDESGSAQTEVVASINTAITSVHGLQTDLSFADTEGGAIGSLGAHLYLAPREGQKYGLFATLSDVDGRAMTWATLGAEGQLSWGLDTVIEMRAGLGVADTSGLDFIFGGVSVAHNVTQEIEFVGSLDFAEFDEASFRAISYDAGLSLHYSPEGAPWGVYASLNHTGLEGRDGTGGDTRIGLGFSMRFGNAGGSDPHTRHFRSIDPVAPLLRRGIY